MIAVALSLLGAIGLATTAVSGRAGMPRVHPVATVGVTLAVGTAGVLLAALVVEKSALWSVPSAVIPWVAAVGMVHFAIGRSSGYISVNAIGASRTALFITAQAPFAAFLAIVFTGEPLRPLVAAGTAAVVVALLLANGDSLTQGWRTDRSYLLGCLTALAAGAGQGGGIVLAKKAIGLYDSPLTVSGLSMLAALLVIVPAVAVAAARYPAVRSFDARSMSLILLSGLTSIVASVGQFLAVQRGDVVVVAPIMATFPLWTLLLSHVFIARLERITPRLITGALLAVGGVIAVALGSQI